MSSSSSGTAAAAVRAAVESLAAVDAAAGSDVDERSISALLTSAVRLYAARVERGGAFPGVASGSITATDALITASTLLRAVNVAPFELGLWEAWS